MFVSSQYQGNKTWVTKTFISAPGTAAEELFIFCTSQAAAFLRQPVYYRDCI